MFSTCFETEGSSSGRRLFISIHSSTYKIVYKDASISTSNLVGRRVCTLIYNRLPEDGPSVSKHVQDIKN
jgi:hypothetical protein